MIKFIIFLNSSNNPLNSILRNQLRGVKLEDIKENQSKLYL